MIGAIVTAVPTASRRRRRRRHRQTVADAP
jgi:hypothetical protein